MKIVRSPGLPRGFSLTDDADAGIALRPIGLLPGGAARDAVAEGRARWLAGGPLAFQAAELFLKAADGLHIAIAPIDEIEAWAVGQEDRIAQGVANALFGLSPPRERFVGVALDRSVIIGIVNVTPDSFFDGGRHADPAAAIAHGEALVAAGADIVDVGGESTRPGSEPVSEGEELDRVLPVVEALARSGAVVSIDTRRPAIMRAALGAGARIVNDIEALQADGAPEAVAEAGASAILMHMQGTPATMQHAPAYSHAPYEVYRFLADRVRALEAAGLGRNRLAVDPGIGFGKTDAHNMQVVNAFSMFFGLGCAVVAGVSRKSFIGRIAGAADGSARLPGTIAATALAAMQGVRIHRVHDAAEIRQALAICDAAGAG